MSTQKPMGKNARKRAARRAFHADESATGPMPHAFKVVMYRDNQRHVLTFASLTSYKKYRERFYWDKTIRFAVAADESEVDDSKGEAIRSSLTNKGIGLHNGKRYVKKAVHKGTPEKRFAGPKQRFAQT